MGPAIPNLTNTTSCHAEHLSTRLRRTSRRHLDTTCQLGAPGAVYLLVYITSFRWSLRAATRRSLHPGSGVAPVARPRNNQALSYASSRNACTPLMPHVAHWHGVLVFTCYHSRLLTMERLRPNREEQREPSGMIHHRAPAVMENHPQASVPSCAGAIA